MSKIYIALLLALPLAASPILVTGHGTFWSNSMQSGCDASISGGDFGDDTLSGGYFVSEFCGPLGGWISGSTQYTSSGSMIDDQGFHPGYGSFWLGEGNGEITGFDGGHNMEIQQEISGYVAITSDVCVPEYGIHMSCEGTFDIVAVPEPSGLVLLGIGLAVLGWRRARGIA